ncbi:YfiT family bacillithiol transferase [Gorillibacterium sp. CAU 1737]|uniref:YfiT family bacillithiol transferase n=1 Tax=Gorillibacterium sp. CAU 1737 TaxID=3140362 RepID=UPI00326172FF
MINIHSGLRLRPFRYPEDCSTALPWYQDKEVLYYSEGKTDGTYDLEVLERMYAYLLTIGEVCLIEVREGENWRAIGDATLSEEDLPIVIGVPDYRSKGIGAQVVRAFIERAKELGLPKLNVRQIYSYNERSRKLFVSLGFRAVDQGVDGNGIRYERFELELSGHTRWNADAEKDSFVETPDPDAHDIRRWIADMERTPELIRRCVEGMTDAQLDMSYREGGWSVRQLVHHLADNDLHAYVRFKRAMTEETPVMPSYEQEKWAELADYREPVEVSLRLMEAVIARLAALVKTMTPDQFQRTLTSSSFGTMTLAVALQRLRWHDRHHLAQIEKARGRGCH